MKKFTDTSEKGLQRHIVKKLVEEQDYLETKPEDFDKKYCVNQDQLFEFIENTQPDKLASIEKRGKREFLARLNKRITEKGLVEIMRKGVNFYDLKVDLFYPQPDSALNKRDKERYEQNIFSVTQELVYSDKHENRLDLVIFINGLPVITSELKNLLTKQNVTHAIRQYQNDRNPKDTIFNFGRCLVHFAVDNDQAFMTTKLVGSGTHFLPFNKGLNAGEPHPPFGRGNPENPDGLKVSYLWEEILTKDSLSNIISKFSQFVTEKNAYTGKKTKKLIFPRYHQLTAVRKLLKDTKETGVGKRYLIQHSTGSGKSFSIVWLTYQLANLFNKNGDKHLFDSVFVVTDRRNLDQNIKEQLKAFSRVNDLVAFIGREHGSKSDQLKEALLEQKKIIVVTVQTFPFVLEKIESMPTSNYAIIIDEAHSSQSGTTAAKMNAVLGGDLEEVPQDEEGNIKTEDFINHLIKQRRMLDNASYYAFTATPKNKTLETFGTKGDDGRYYPFHLYPMKQAIEEDFILDVLSSYTTYTSYYKLAKKIEGNPEFDVKEANRKLRVFVESHPKTIEKKAKIMVDHFHNAVAHRIDGQAKAMVVTRSIHCAMKYKDACDDYLKKIDSPYEAIVAFSGTKPHYQTGEKLTEMKMNNFEDGINDIREQFKKDKYRFLIVAEKFQTGFDEPLLHTMYVDKRLAGLQAVQTLSRLNRSHKNKQDTFVLDFYNESEEIKEAFKPYYTATVLSESTDPNRLNDLQVELDEEQIYTPEDVDRFFETLKNEEGRDVLDPQLDSLVAIFDNLEKEEQIEFKSNAKSFVRLYSYLSRLLDFEKQYWEKLYWLLKLLVTKLRIEEDGEEENILETVDIDSFRPSKGTKSKIYLEEDEGEVEPIMVKESTVIDYGEEKDTLENILREFNKRFGNIDWKEPDKVEKTLTKDIPELMRQDKKTINSIKKSDRQNAQIAANDKLKKTILGLMKSQTEIYKKFMEDDNFRENYQDFVFELLWGEEKD